MLFFFFHFFRNIYNREKNEKRKTQESSVVA